jgi:hypothetical protein
MNGIAEEVCRASEELGIQVHTLTMSQRKVVRAALLSKFGRDARFEFNFNNMQEYASLYHPDSWRWIDGLLPDAPVYLLTDPRDEDVGFEFTSGSSLLAVLGECFPFVFYVTDLTQSFVVGQDNHDVLIGAGSAMAWIHMLEATHSAPDSSSDT